MTVAVIRNDEGKGSLETALELCNGLSNLKSTDKVLLKPNLVIGGHKSQRPDGVVTTTNMIEWIIDILRDYGISDITIGDGGVIHREINLNTLRAYEWSGVGPLAQKLGIETLDLNKGPFTTVDFDGIPIKIATSILEADFVINMPVLKTHQLTKVSLGLKNLKGCMANQSKKNFHRNGLEESIALLGTKITTDLTIIDGTFGLQRGPVGNDAHRFDLIIAGKDVAEVDAIGAYILGLDPREVIHLHKFYELQGKELDLSKIEVKGEQLGKVRHPLEWVSHWPQELMEAYNIKGVKMDTPGYSNCSGCGMGIFVAVNNFFRQHRNTTFNDVEICVGREPVASPDAKKVFCLGKCACDTNKDHPNAIKIGGCPPSVKRSQEVLEKELCSQVND